MMIVQPRRRWTAAIAASLALMLVLSACGDGDDSADLDADADAEPEAEADPDAEAAGEASPDDATWAGVGGGEDGVLQVAFVYVGPVGDAGWTFAHNEGRLALEEALGDQVETSFLESVEEGAPAERVFEDLAREGYELIFGTSFGYMDPMEAIAPRYPDVVFEHATGYKTGENLATYFGAAEEARYLSGIVAGNASETGELGYVAAFPIPEVIRGINAFTLGVREVDPDATVQVVWTSTWYGPDLEKQAAESLLDRGVDVVAQHQDTPAPGQAAEERGAYWLGYNSDMERFAPDAWLTAPVWDWGPYYVETAQAVIDGTWQTREYYGSMADGMVDLAPFGAAVDDETIALVDERRQEIVDGSFAPFTGPLTDQDGTVRVEDGVAMTLGDLLSMDWFVEGVVGSPAG
jgi:basic membrane protein A and related proteins